MDTVEEHCLTNLRSLRQWSGETQTWPIIFQTRNRDKKKVFFYFCV